MFTLSDIVAFDQMVTGALNQQAMDGIILPLVFSSQILDHYKKKDVSQ